MSMLLNCAMVLERGGGGALDALDKILTDNGAARWF